MRRLAPLLLTLLTTSTLQSSANATQGVPPAAPPTLAPFQILTNSASEYAHFNSEVVRGFAFSATGDTMYALNCYEGTINVFRPNNPQADPDGVSKPLVKWRTLADPVSVALHSGSVYVVGSGNHAIARHDEVTGRITGIVNLLSEPSDLVIDAGRDTAWVSCMGADAVVELELSPNFSIRNVWDESNGLVCKRPRFLALSDVDDDGSMDRLTAAAFISGNGTFAVRTGNPVLGENPDRSLAPAVIHNGRDNAFNGNGWTNGYGVLPDHDVFQLNLTAAGSQFQPFVHSASTLMTAHGAHPDSGDYWMLGIDALNADFASEPALNGQFARNEFEIIDAANVPTLTSTAPAAAGMNGDIDDLNADPAIVTYDAAKSLSFPYALAFGSVQGTTAIAVSASTAPYVALLRGNGARLTNGGMPLPTSGPKTGLVPRTLIFQDDALFIYCQQSGNVLRWDITLSGTDLLPAALPSLSFDLGNDPTPADIASGRAIWYDATRSLDGRTSCNTCHPGGESDMLAWPLTAEVTDFKDVMVTQTLKGAAETFPFHWRGERDLFAFNDAFKGLLGGDAVLTTGSNGANGEFEDLQSFIFSLQPYANPRLDLDRVLKNELADEQLANGFSGEAVRGQLLFHNEISGINLNCFKCHPLPTGSNGHVHPANNLHNIGDPIGDLSTNEFSETAQLFNTMQLKEQPQLNFTHTASGVTTIYEVPLLGFGLRHAGNNPSLHDFMRDQFPLALSTPHMGMINASGEQNAADVRSFIRLIDSGTAPSAHHTIELNSNTSNVVATISKIKSKLMRQSRDRWIDVFVIGQVEDPAGQPIRVNWWYDFDLKRFVAEDHTMAPRTIGQFNPNGNGLRDNVFFGCLPGHGERLGIDYDNDQLITSFETLIGTDVFDPDTDEDQFSDGYERINGMDPTTPTAVNNDSTDPSLVATPTLDFENGVLAEIHFEADEPVTWTIDATGPLDGDVSLASNTLARRHTTVISGLRPSGRLNSPFPAVYDLSLTITDQAQRSTTYNYVDFITTDPANAGSQLVATDTSYAGSYTTAGGAGYIGVYRATIVDPDTEFLDGVAESLMVVQAIRRATDDDPWEVVPISDVTVTAPDSYLTPTLQVFESGMTVSTSMEPFFDAPYILMPRTTASGLTSAVIEISGLGSTSDQVAIQVLDVREVHSSTPPGTFPTFAGNTRYNMPMTSPEDRLRMPE